MKWTDLDFFKNGDDRIVTERIAKDINAGVKICPPIHQIMRALDITPFDTIKCAIIGQDPYPTKNHANGLAFSVSASVEPIPKSLKNIFTELEADTGIQKTCGSLAGWARQGVLLLNTVLTVTEGQAGSHQGYGWESLTGTKITIINIIGLMHSYVYFTVDIICGLINDIIHYVSFYIIYQF